MKKSIRIMCAAGSLASLSALASIHSGAEHEVMAATSGAAQHASTANPASPINTAVETSIDRSLLSLERTGEVHAAEESEAFRYPAVFAEYGFTEMKDDRANGFDTVTQSLTLGMDFMTVADLFVGGMVSFAGSNGDSEADANSDGDAWTFTLYGSKAIAENIFAGVSLSFSHNESDNETVQDIHTSTTTKTYAIAPYVSFVKRIDQFVLSLTPTYSLSFAETDEPVTGKDKSTRGEILLVARATYMASETVSLFAGATVHQVVHSRLMDSENGQDHCWIGTSVGINWYASENLKLQASVGYDAFNKNYDNNVNAYAGMTYSF